MKSRVLINVEWRQHVSSWWRNITFNFQARVYILACGLLNDQRTPVLYGFVKFKQVFKSAGEAKGDSL